LGLFADGKAKATVKKKLIVLKQGEYLLNRSRDHSDSIVLLYLRYLTACDKPLYFLALE